MKKLIALCLLIAGFNVAHAEEESNNASFDREFTLGLSFPRQTFGGDFDGKRFYQGNNFIVVVPDVDPAWGIGLNGGIKSRVGETKAVGIDVGVSVAEHDASVGGTSLKADSFHLDLNFRLFFNVLEKTQPFIFTGVSASALTVQDGYISPTEKKDATFSGTGVHIGAGLNYYLSPRVSVNGSIRHRWMTFNEVDYGSRSKLSNKLKSTAVDVAVELAYHFNLSRNH